MEKRVFVEKRTKAPAYECWQVWILRTLISSTGIDVTLPKSWVTERILVTNHNAKEMDVRRVSTSDGVILRFNVRPIDAEYTIEKMLHPN